MTYRANPNASIRFSAGSAIAPPYLNLLNRSATRHVLSQDQTYATNTATSRDFRPETSFGYDLGGDFRLYDGQTMLTADIYRTTLQNQFITSQFGNGCSTAQTRWRSALRARARPARCRSTARRCRTSATRATRASKRPWFAIPRSASASACRARSSTPTLTTFPSASTRRCRHATSGQPGRSTRCQFPEQRYERKPGSFNSVSNHAIPYSQGYAEIQFRTNGGGYASLGEQYYGPNNSLNVPPFFSPTRTSGSAGRNIRTDRARLQRR